MKIFIDMDETIVSMTQPLLDIYNKENNQNITKEDITFWNFDKYLIQGKAVEIFSRDGFFLDLKPYPTAIEGIESLLYKFAKVYIITNPSGNGNIAKQKYEWIQKYLPFFPMNNVIMNPQKHLMNTKKAILIDDAPHYLNSWYNNGGFTIKIDRPWNKGIISDFEVYDNDFKKINEIIDMFAPFLSR